MYKSFYGFHSKPFELTPDPKFLYLSAGLREILASLEYGIIQKRGFMLLVGNPGTGKTTLINSLIEKSGIDAEFAYIFNPDLNFYELLHTVLINFNLANVEEELSKTKAMHRLNSFAFDQFQKGRNTVIIVDEAQTLDIKTLETLRLLSNFETHSHKLLQIIISGQTELEKTLNNERLTQLSQRFGLRCRTVNFSERETYEYIAYRLNVVGCLDSQLFSNKAKFLIWSYTKGNPRIINIICDNSLLAGYASDKKQIDSFIVKEAIDDLKKIPLSRIDYPEDDFREMTLEKYQTPPDKSVDIRETSPEISRKKDDHTADIINSIRRKILPAEELKHREKRNRQLSFAKISIIAIAVSAVTFFIAYILAPNFIGKKREISSGSGMTKEAESDQEQNEIIRESAIPNAEKLIELDENSESDAHNNGENIIPEDKSVYEENSSANSSDDNKTEIPKFIHVKKGETLGYIMSKVYGKTNPKILAAILKINPDIKNPNFIYENQIIKLPQNVDLD
jgi:type II secretory pathway predicted ATPase ExeA